MEKIQDELYGIIAWEDGKHTMCAQITAEFVKNHVDPTQGTVLVDRLSLAEVEVFMKLLPRDATMNNAPEWQFKIDTQ